MKHFRLFLLLTCLPFLLNSCGENPSSGDDTPASLSLNPAELVFSSDVSTQTINVESNAKWYLDASEMWCQTSVTSGSGNGSVNVTVSANTLKEARTATITFTSPGTEKQVVKVTQNATQSQEMELDPDPWDGKKRADISYQLLIYSFADSNADGIGDFQGIRSKLDYLDELGVSAIWLSPAHPASSYHGYDVLDYEALNPKYGTEEDFKALIDDAHAHGIKIYMDYVINHTSVNHPWFKDAISSPDSEHRDWYVLSEDPAADIAAGRIPMIATEGKNGYDSNQWYSAVAGGSKEMKVKFTLKCSSSGTPQTLKIEEVDEIANNGSASSGKYLWWGDPGKATEFYSEGNGIYTLSLSLNSPWGVLVRTSKTTWDNGTKFGAPSNAHQLEWGKELTLSSSDANDILLPGMKGLYYHSHFWTGAFADLNYGSADKCGQSPAFEAIVKAAEKWIDLGVDGFRLDGAKHVYHNASSDENPTFWNSFYTTLNSYYRKSHSGDLYMVGEVYDDYQAAAPYYKGFPALFEFAFWYRLQWAIQNSTGCYFAKDIISYQDIYKSYRADYHEATKLSNHDEDRTGSTLNANADMMKMAGAVLLTSGGEPYIYYGEELGYLGVKDSGDENVRTPMKWGDSYTTNFIKQYNSGQDKVKSVKDQEADQNSMLSVYRNFAQLRNTYPALAEGKMSAHPLYNDSNSQYKQVACWYMSDASQKMLVVHNISSKAVTLNFSDPIDKAVASMGEVSGSLVNSNFSLRLGGWSSAVLLLK
ncbi:MAG: alpha-amylase family glycosyl hydrolase [Bacteroidales bacterium]|nr:alpha-amylase family glycosyl hydrolase [Bacteroidales bacterium]